MVGPLGVAPMATFDADFFIALGTMVLAVGTVALAFFTYRLASATSREQRADWRPVLIPFTSLIEHSGESELRVKLQNVGRGPALGVGGQLRIEGPSGAAVSNQPSICVAGGWIDLRFSIHGDHGLGIVRHFEITYYDIGEWWHVTDLKAMYEREGDDHPLRIVQTFVSESDRQLLPIFGSRNAQARKARRSTASNC